MSTVTIVKSGSTTTSIVKGGVTTTTIAKADVGSYTWYLDSSAGAGGDGKNSATAFKTVAALVSNGISAGDRIGVAKGSLFREQLTISVNNVTIEAYGTGAAPIIAADNVISAGDWSKTDGQTNVYDASITPVWTDANDWLNVFEDGAFLVRVANIATCDSTAGSYYPSDSTGTITLYIHPKGSTDPTSDGKVYEYSHRYTGILGTFADGMTIIGITTRRNLGELGSMALRKSATVTDCNCNDGTKHNIYVCEGAYLDTVICTNAYYGGQPRTHFVCYQSAATGLGYTVIDCQAIDEVYDATEVSTGFYQHTDGNGSLGVIQYTNIVAENCIVGIDTASTDYTSFTVTTADFSTCDYAIALWKSATISGLTHNIKTDKRSITFYATDITLNLSGSTTLTLTGANVSAGIIYSTYANSIVNLTASVAFVATAYVFAITFAGGASTSSVTVTGCTFDYIAKVYNVLGDTTVVSDYNNFLAAWYTFTIGATTYANVAEWQAAGYDLNSSVP